MNDSFHSLAPNNEPNHACKKRDHSVGPPSPLDHEVDENLAPFPLLGHDSTMSDGSMPVSVNDAPHAKRSKMDLQPHSQPSDQPVLQLHVREASMQSHEEDRSDSMNVDQPSQSLTASTKKSYKNHNLNILIPPLAPASDQSLGPLSAGSGSEDPVTPLYQIVHTPTTAPGAPGPGNPAETRRLEQSWAKTMNDDDRFSPVFSNFRLGEERTEHLLQRSRNSNDGTSAALREIFTLTATAKTPTFAPDSFALTFGNGDDDCESHATASESR